MSAKRRRKANGAAKHDEQTSGVFEVPPSSRVARRGSTRVEIPVPAEPAPRWRARLTG